MIGWLEQEYWVINGFEMQYRGINPKILVQPLLRDNINIPCEQIHVYCFNGKPEYIVKLYNDFKIWVWDKNLNLSDCNIGYYEQMLNIKADNLIKQAVVLSEKLARAFNFVRIDWMLNNSSLYFGEITFTPFSGFVNIDKRLNFEL